MARVSKPRLIEEPFAGIVAARQAEIRAEVEASRIDPYVHGRVFAFSELTSVWPTTFLERVGVRFKQVAAGLASQTVKPPYLRLLDLLGWIGASDAPHCRAVVAEAVERGRIRSADE